MVLLTFAMARCAPVEVERAILRKASATQHDDWRDRERNQRELPIAVEEKRGHEDHEQHLAGEAERQGDDVGELFGVGGHAGNDAARTAARRRTTCRGA